MNRRTFFKFFTGVAAAATALPFIPKAQAKSTAASGIIERILRSGPMEPQEVTAHIFFLRARARFLGRKRWEMVE